MPKTAKGKKIMAAMKREYGAEKGEQVFYASENAGTISGVHKRSATGQSRASATGIARSAKGQARAVAASSRKKAAKKVTSSTSSTSSKKRTPAKKTSSSTRKTVAKRFYGE